MCDLRLRVLYQKTACPMCKVDNQTVYVGKRALTGEFEELRRHPRAKPLADEKLGLIYESEAVRRDVEDLLKLKCCHAGCSLVFNTKADLKRHTASAHGQQLCEICLAHKKVFASEYKLFNSNSLAKHHKDAHPTCKLCGTFFFSEDEQVEHYRDKHEKCHICWKRDPTSSPYFRDYNSLVQLPCRWPALTMCVCV